MAQKEQKEPIVYKVELLEELIERQQRLLTIANEIIDGKNRLIELCELEIELHRRENKRLRTSLIISGIIFALLAVINLTRLLV
jgi:hypothetical protein